MNSLSPYHTGTEYDKSGMTLVIVVVVMLISAIVTASVLARTGTRLRIGQSQVRTEQAFFLAEAGLERGAKHIADGHETSTFISGQLGGGRYETHVHCDLRDAGEVYVVIASTGIVDNVRRAVTVKGLQKISWARYALWYDRQNLDLVMAAGESFRGRVYARPLMRFNNQNIATKGKVHFYDRVWTVQDRIQVDTGADPILDMGIVLNSELQDMSTVDLPKLQSTAADGGLVIEGDTTITLDGDKLKITNNKLKWNQKVVDIPPNGVVYAKAARWTERVGNRNVTYDEKGDVTLSGPTGFKGKLTIVSERNIKITNHVKYHRNPMTYDDSTDALGLVARNNVTVETVAPNNLEIFAHIICRDGGFGVVNYDDSNKGARGTLLVYGGIANLIRNAVGTVSARSTGYLKDYRYDPRLVNNPPPHYPKLSDELEWTNWEG